MNREIDGIFSTVSREFGKVLPLKIRKNAPSAYFDWESITIPEDFLEWDPDKIRNVIRHEFGHLFFSPRDPDVGTAMAYIAQVIGYDDPWKFVNILTDIIVDTTNMEMFGQEYLEFLEWSFEHAKDRCGMLRAMEGVYREKARELGFRTKLRGDEKGAEIYRILMDKERDFYSKVVKIANLLLERQRGCSMPMHFVIYIFSKDGNPAEIAGALVRAGMDPKVMNGLEKRGGFFAGNAGMFTIDDPVMIEYRKMMVIAKYLELENSFGERERMEREVSMWNLGDYPGDLDFLGTLASYGIIVPGIYSLKRKPMRTGTESGGSRYRDGIIVLDCSGSMEGEKFDRAREAAYVIAKKTHDDGGRIGLVPFSGFLDSEYVVHPTRDHWRVMNLLFRIHPSGGTNMGSALEEAISMGRNYHVYIISDAEVYDMERTAHLLRQLGGRATFFHVDYDHESERWFEMEGVKVIEVSPDGMVRRVYEEVKGK